MKKYLKHLMAVAVCLVVAVGLFAGCTANLGTELTADADVETAKTYVIEAVEATKAYTDGFIKKTLKRCGFELVAVYDDVSFDAPARNSEKVFYVAKKPVNS